MIFPMILISIATEGGERDTHRERERERCCRERQSSTLKVKTWWCL